MRVETDSVATEFAGYRLGDTFTEGSDQYSVIGFGITFEGEPALFGGLDGNTIYAFEADDLPPNMGNRAVLEKMTKKELVDLVLAM